MHVTYSHVVQEAPAIRTFYFRPARRFRYQPGQFIELSLPLPDGDGYDRRWFSLSSSPTEPLLAITSRLTDHPSPFKQALMKLQTGDAAVMSDSMGDFTLPLDMERPLVFIAIGIGIAPFRSMLQYVNDVGQTRHIRLLYGEGVQTNLIFQDILSQSGLVQLTTLSKRAVTGWPGQRGIITGGMIYECAKVAPEALVYIAGPEREVMRLADEVRHLGYPAGNILTDCFIGYMTE